MTAVILAAVTALVLSGCAGDPDLDDLAPRLEQDGLALVHYLADGYAEPPEAVQVVSDGSADLACNGDGRQRKFEAGFPMRRGDPDSNLDLFSTTVWAAFNVPAPRDADHPEFFTSDDDYYTVTEHGRPDDLGSERTWRATNDGETIRFEIRAAGHPGSMVAIFGETVCVET